MKDKLTRRSFVSTAAVLAGGVVAGAQASKEDKEKVATSDFYKKDGKLYIKLNSGELTQVYPAVARYT